MNLETLSISNLASRIIMDMEGIAKAKHKYWRAAFPYAAPYADAMMSLQTVNDHYGFDSGFEIVARFLSNASTWKGETAKAIKAELRKRIGLKK